eukprot:TRINITY_DN56421_c0_g1_i1.p1 TRINITY_DN56421_c0_g1~~TRINITY_DN56421_c0_g1_i1.p1  ORF type:complete len:146 (+),score=22.72 TRINITY_DN56421_c0_g1_i1:62-499(+)
MSAPEEDEGPSGPNIEVTSIDLQPAEECAFEDGLGLTMNFTTDAELSNFCWRVRYVVDTSKKRLIVDVGSTDPLTYPPGTWAMEFSSPPLDLASVPQALYSQTNGLLVAALTGPAGEEVFAANMVVQIRVDESGQLRRFIYNPMD